MSLDLTICTALHYRSFRYSNGWLWVSRCTYADIFSRELSWLFPYGQRVCYRFQTNLNGTEAA